LVTLKEASCKFLLKLPFCPFIIYEWHMCSIVLVPLPKLFSGMHAASAVGAIPCKPDPAGS